MDGDRVLVVEDDLALREVLARGLREQGFEVVTAPDGTTAMGLAAQGCDALVLDIGLPDTDGRDLCQALRARGLDAPVLFLTAADRLPDLLSGFAAGGDDYLAKPFHFAELVARLRALLKRARPAAAAPRTACAWTRLGTGWSRPPARRRSRRPSTGCSRRCSRRPGPSCGAWSWSAAAGPTARSSTTTRSTSTSPGCGASSRRWGAEATITTARGVGYRYA